MDSNLYGDVKTKRRQNNSTAMAGEFYVMERLYRLGHEPALTLGNAKSIDIIVKLRGGGFKSISVKSVCGGGKWGVGASDLSNMNDVVFVFLLYKNFDDVSSEPLIWIMPADQVEINKSKWFNQSAIYYSRKLAPINLDYYRNAWNFIK